MCLQDIAIGQASVGTETTVNIGLTDTQAIAADNARTTLVFGPPQANTVWLTTENAAALGTGFILTPTSPPLVITLRDWGSLVTKQWRGIASVGAENISVVTASLNEAQYKSKWRALQLGY